MEQGICTVSVAPLRAEAAHQAEMTSQLLFGETVDILELGSKFLKVKMHFDGYEGYADAQQIAVFESQKEILPRTILTKNLGWHQTDHGNLLLSAGAEIPSENEQGKPKELSPEAVAETAKMFCNVPYLWSGRSIFGIDCSGLVQLVYKIHGVALPRDSYRQAEMGQVLSFLEESKPGDLAFFDDEEGRIRHVGLILEEQKIIHAFGKVRIDSLDSSGIFNKQLNRHTHRLRFVRSIF